MKDVLQKIAGECPTMLQSDQIDELITLVAAMDREALTWQFRSYPTRFPIDFTPQFLSTTSLDELRHIFVAVCLQNQRMPMPEQFSSPVAA
jgi:hypothetical protein